MVAGLVAFMGEGGGSSSSYFVATTQDHSFTIAAGGPELSTLISVFCFLHFLLFLFWNMKIGVLSLAFKCQARDAECHTFYPRKGSQKQGQDGIFNHKIGSHAQK